MKLVIGFAQIEMSCGLFNNKKIREAIKELMKQDNSFKNFSNKAFCSTSYLKTENYLSNKLNLIISRIK